MNVLVIPEDFRKDQYILAPILKALLAAAGVRNANLRVCQDPLLGGVREALKWNRVRDVLERYRGMVDLFILCVDRDGDAGRRQQLDRIEVEAGGVLPSSRVLLAENAWQEIEVWLLAGHDLPGEWAWTEVRTAVNPKERYFLPLARQRRLQNEPAEGRRTLAEEASRRYDRIRRLCPEDVQALEHRVREWIGARA